ncbi:MAG: histidine kinase dimerization/phosphoacceptor domain -containing protein [Flavobacteriales bacterium]
MFLIAESTDSTNPYGKIMFHWANGKGYYYKSDFFEAYSHLEKAARIADKLYLPTLKAEIYLDLSAALSIVDQNGKALSYLLESNSIFAQHGSVTQKVRSGISLGEFYRKTAEHSTAYKVLNKLRADAEKNPETQAMLYNRLAAVHSETGELDSSLYYSYRALNIAEKLNDPSLIATSENEIGYVLRVQRKLEESLPHFFRADSIWQNNGMLRYAINAMHHISVVYGTLNRLKESAAITHKALHLTKNKKWYQIECLLLEDLRNISYQLNRQDSGIYYEKRRLESVINWKDEQYSQNTKMVEALFSQSRNEQKIREQEILIKNERLEKESVLKEKTIYTLGLSLAFILLLSLAGYGLIQRKTKIRLRKENSEKEKRNQELKSALVANEALVQEISHRVKNNLAVLAGLLQMQLNRSENDQVKSELKDSIMRIDSIASIHKHLYDKDNDAKINMGKALLNLTENILLAMGKKPSECLGLSIENAELSLSKAVPVSLIVNELITNSCKHAPVDRSHPLHLSLKSSGKSFIVSLSDMGEGIPADYSARNGKSLGLYLIQMLSSQINGSAAWKKKGDEFIFSITFPKDEPVA